MNDEEERILIPITWNKGGTNVFITGTFEEYNYAKLSDINQNSESKEKSILLWLKPGVYYYRFIVDGKDLLDESKPIKTFEDKPWNVITVEKLLLPDNLKIQKLSVNELLELDKLKLDQDKDDQNVQVSFNARSREEQESEAYPSVLNRNNTNAICTDKSNYSLNIRNTSLQKNLSKLKTSSLNIQNNNCSKNISNLSLHNQNNFLDISENFSMNVENVANNYMDSYMFPDNFMNEVTDIDLSQMGNNFKDKDGSNNVKTQTKQENYKNATNNFVIVYKIAADFLVPMKIIGEDEKTNLIKLRFLNISDHCNSNRGVNDISVKKEGIFFQPLSEFCLNGVENLADLDIFNELSILKNLMIRFYNNMYFCTMNDIFIFFSNKKNSYIAHAGNENGEKMKIIMNEAMQDEEQVYSEYKFEFCEWLDLKLDQSQYNNLILVKIKEFSHYNFHTSKPNINFEIISQVIKYKNFYFYENFKDFFDKVYTFLQYFDMNALFFVSFSKNYKNFANFQFYPLFPTQTFKNKLKTDFILWKSVGSKTNSNPNDKVLKRKYPNEQISVLFEIGNIYHSKYNQFFNDITKWMLENDITSALFLEAILEILIELNSEHLFKDLSSLFTLSYILAHFKSIFSNMNSSTKAKNQVNKSNPKSIYEEIFEFFNLQVYVFNTYNTENLMFYSNICLIFIYKYINDLISLKFKENLNPKGFANFQNSKNFTNNLINIATLLPDFSQEEDINLFNEILLNKISADSNINNFNSNSNLSISKYLQYNLNENLTSFNKNLTYSQIDFNLILFFENIFDQSFKSFNDFYKINQYIHSLNNPKYIKLLELIQTTDKNSQTYLEKLEQSDKSLVIKQIWTFEFDNFDKFFTVEENVIDILQNNKFIEYLKFYKTKNYSNNMFYAEYSMEQFFHKFLPILEDIDTIYDPNKNYIQPLSYFFDDLQKFEEFEEKFEISEEVIKINFQSYSIIVKLLKNVIEEKIVIIQKHYKKKVIYSFINFFRSHVKKIQSAWRKYFMSKISENNMDTNKLFIFFANRYKKSDPVALKIFRVLNKKNNSLFTENKKIENELNIQKNENLVLKSQVNELNRKISRLQNESISMSSSTNSILSSDKKQRERFMNHNQNTKYISQANSCISEKNGINKSGSSLSTLNINKKLNNNSNSSPKTSHNESNLDTTETRKALESKLTNYKNKYRDLVKVVSEHEKKIEKFVSIINSVSINLYINFSYRSKK